MTKCLRVYSLATAAAILVPILVGMACSDASTAPSQTGGIRASVEITGGEPTDSTFTITVDSSTRTFASAAGGLVIAGLSAGPHTLALKVPAQNCSVTGSDSESITVRAGATVDVMFDVECKTTGIEITTHSTGLDIPSSYAVLVSGGSGAPRPAEPNGLLLVSPLVPGSYTVTLMPHAENCQVSAANPITADVVNRAVTAIAFEVVCVHVERPEKIAYEGENATSQVIRLVNPDGSGEIDLGNGSAPSWSPDGTRLVFSTIDCFPYDGCFPTGNLAVMDADGGNIQGLAAGHSPAWSPSGDVIAFVGFSDSLPGFYLVRARFDGSPTVKVAIPGVDGADHPAWSPDGQRIAFECFFAPASYDVCIVNKDGTGLVRLSLTDSPGSAASWPAWSPDGRTIAFAAARLGIAVIAADGSTLRFVADGREPAWSRDGSQLVFARSDGLFVIGADGSNLKRLTTGNDGAPAWRP